MGANSCKCPSCGSKQSHIIDSRANTGGDFKRRRRVCDSCGYRWSTVEITLEDFQSIPRPDEMTENALELCLKDVEKIDRKLELLAVKTSVLGEQSSTISMGELYLRAKSLTESINNIRKEMAELKKYL